MLRRTGIRPESHVETVVTRPLFQRCVLDDDLDCTTPVSATIQHLDADHEWGSTSRKLRGVLPFHDRSLSTGTVVGVTNIQGRNLAADELDCPSTANCVRYDAATGRVKRYLRIRPCCAPKAARFNVLSLLPLGGEHGGFIAIVQDYVAATGQFLVTLDRCGNRIWCSDPFPNWIIQAAVSDDGIALVTAHSGDILHTIQWVRLYQRDGTILAESTDVGHEEHFTYPFRAGASDWIGSNGTVRRRQFDGSTVWDLPPPGGASFLNLADGGSEIFSVAAGPSTNPGYRIEKLDGAFTNLGSDFLLVTADPAAAHYFGFRIAPAGLRLFSLPFTGSFDWEVDVGSDFHANSLSPYHVGAAASRIFWCGGSSGGVPTVVAYSQVDGSFLWREKALVSAELGTHLIVDDEGDPWAVFSTEAPRVAKPDRING